MLHFVFTRAEAGTLGLTPVFLIYMRSERCLGGACQPTHSLVRCPIGVRWRFAVVFH